MSKTVTITLDDDVLEFVEQLDGDLSACINGVLRQEQRRRSTKAFRTLHGDQAMDPKAQKELSAWDVTVGDGLDW